jgi:hypothetical protein
MEDASGEDLDWFWRGWFYGTDACDIALDSVKYARPELDATPPETKERVVKQNLAKPLGSGSFDDLSKIRNRENKSITFQTDADTSLRDFYWRYARGMEPYDTAQYEVKIPAGGAEALDADGKAKYGNKHMYELSFSNKGGLVMPIIIEWTYKDGTKEVDRIPAQVWRLNETKVIKTFIKDKEVASIKLDPMRETADINTSNNSWNTMPEASRFTIFKQKQTGPRPQVNGVTPMQKSKEKKGF